MSTLVGFEVRDTVAIVTLNDAQRMNPLSQALQDALSAAVTRVEDDRSIRAMLLTGAGRGFCVGADLKDFEQRSRAPAAGESLGRHVGRMMEESANVLVARLRHLPVPLVCAVNGAAAGGGVGIALAADLVIAARSAYFYLPFVPSLGLVPDMGATWALPRLIGQARSLGLALTGEKLGAERAAAWGLIWACADDERLQQEAFGLAARLACLPAHAVSEARAIFAAGQASGLDRQLALERERQEALIDGPAFAEGLAAYLERRKPVFPGRS